VASESISRVRVRYAETDQMGVVYYANYLVWFEVGRTDWLRSLGWTYREMEESGILLPVIEAQCEYRAPARYDDEVEIRTTGRLLSLVRVSFSDEVRLGPDAQLSALGQTTHAATGRDGKPCRLPDRIE
jgi:acyl-CoA thioester hydrolase